MAFNYMKISREITQGMYQEASQYADEGADYAMEQVARLLVGGIIDGLNAALEDEKLSDRQYSDIIKSIYNTIEKYRV